MSDQRFLMEGSGSFPRLAPPQQHMTKGQPKKRRGGWWCLSSHELKGKDTWFKSPRDTSWTIDSTISGKQKPPGYDSNSLITILRSSQCLTAIMVLILYVFTQSAPSFWLLLLGAVTSVLSGGWSIFALYLRHQWATALLIPEVLLTVAWIVLFAASSLNTPDESKYTWFRLAVLAMEASMVLWIQTCLLMVTPIFHKLIPWLFRPRSHKGARPDMELGNRAIEPSDNGAGLLYNGFAFPQPPRPMPEAHMRPQDPISMMPSASEPNEFRDQPRGRAPTVGSRSAPSRNQRSASPMSLSAAWLDARSTAVSPMGAPFRRSVGSPESTERRLTPMIPNEWV
ncbi:hypothetical protein GGR54DRAFT_640329 [Hypoxylon sp. NC1633]|nr:hypothetical protein GGR54DRAFT_640329 [Hypoxylon sp. NC1633]